jgi:hypothetical protein
VLSKLEGQEQTNKSKNTEAYTRLTKSLKLRSK